MTENSAKQAAKRPALIDRIIGILEVSARRWSDDSEFTASRLSAIEDRLAKIDYGYASGEAMQAALCAVNDIRSAGAHKPLSFRVATGKRLWDER